MDDQISRNTLLRYVADWQYSEAIVGNEAVYDTIEKFYHMVEEMPSAQPEQIARDIATIIENEKDMRVILKNAEHTETHSCDCERTGTHDLVSRRAALEAMDTWDKFGCDPDGKLVRYDDDKHYVPYVHYEDMVYAVKNLPSAQPRWILVAEALPEDACQCIVTAKVKHVDNYPDYEVDTADFADGIFTTTNSWWGVESIIAWMPLPEAYKERREE